MKTHGKKFRAAAEKRGNPETRYQPRQAIDLVKSTAFAKFDETVEIAVRLGDEGEGFIRVDGDLDRENRILALRPSVELFAEGHDVDSLGTESRSHGRGRIRLACRDLQFDETNCLFCHDTPQ